MALAWHDFVNSKEDDKFEGSFLKGYADGRYGLVILLLKPIILIQILIWIEHQLSRWASARHPFVCSHMIKVRFEEYGIDVVSFWGKERLEG